jgi:uncharacterized repeat protein (TIGR01451 family)
MNAQTASTTQSQHLVPRVAEAGSRLSRNYPGLLASLGFAALLCVPSTTWAQVAPPLGVAQQFGALGHSAVTGSTGFGTVVNGDVGSSPTATISNFGPSSTVPPFIVHQTGTQPDGVVQQAHADAITAYNFLLTQGPGTVLADNLATVGPLTSGIYSFTSGAPDLPASATLTLNGPGIFVFNVGNSLTANVLSNVVGTADPCNIYWRVGVSATLNGTTFRGTVIADASITVGADANLTGRALAGTGATGAVTMAANIIASNTIGGCSTLVTAPVVVPTDTPGVALSKAFFPTTMLPGGDSLLTITLSNNSTTPSTLSSALVDTLPSGLTTVGSPTTTCTGTPPTATTSSVTLPIGAIIPGATPPPGFCTVIVHVTSAAGGSFSNTLPIGALCIGLVAPICNTAAAVASLGPLTVAAPIPTLSEWAMIMLAALLVLFGVAGIRRYAM